jgi:hypothetical protein
MKTVKVTLASVVIITIIIAIFRGCMSISDSDKIQSPGNTNKVIENKIDSLKKIPESSFCDKLYKDIKYYIEDDYDNNRFSKNKSENEQWKKNLSSQLYAAYTDKFINQSFYVLEGSKWEILKLNFIRKEYQELQKEGRQKGLLEYNSDTDKKLNEINVILTKYDEITGFINMCKTFDYHDYTLPAEFPVAKVENDISRSKQYINNKLENNYVNKCERLKVDLNAVPQILFKAHVKYLDKKIKELSGKYIEYINQPHYKTALYDKLLYQINNLNQDFYPNTDDELARLVKNWQDDDDNAYYHFRKN